MARYTTHPGIAIRLKELRLKTGLSQENLAYDMDISPNQYRRYEAGINLTIRALTKILDYHKISLREFFNHDLFTKCKP